MLLSILTLIDIAFLFTPLFILHAWDEPICDFVEAIERSGEEGPFWICALSIYQNCYPSKGVTIVEQLGSDPKFEPFATVLRCAELMLVVLTHECNIYTRLWYVHGNILIESELLLCYMDTPIIFSHPSLSLIYWGQVCV